MSQIYHNIEMKKDIQIRIIENIRSLMLERGYKHVTDFAKAIKIPRTTITCWLTLKRIPKADAIESLADFFGVTIDELFGR